MPEDHLRERARFQRNAVYILDHRKPIRDERVPERVLFPIYLCSVSGTG